MAQVQQSPNAAVWRLQIARNVVLLAVLCGLSACTRPADEQRLRDTLVALQDAAERRSSDDFMAAVSDNFAGPSGLDRDGLRRLLMVQFLRNQSIGASIAGLELKVENGLAEANFRVLVTGGDGGWIPRRADGYRVSTGWRADGEDWLLERASWE